MKNKKLIIPAIISKTQDELNEHLDKIKDYLEKVQLDIIDEIFVPNSSLDFDFNIGERNIRVETHLMINNPMNWTEKNWQ